MAASSDNWEVTSATVRTSNQPTSCRTRALNVSSRTRLSMRSVAVPKALNIMTEPARAQKINASNR
eukprot:scaffold15737_cov59-Cylindrotheca_fusiformis.AAC.1